LNIPDDILLDLVHCAEDSQFCSQYFFSHIFTRPEGPADEAIYDLFDAYHQYKAAAGFRGVGKTTKAKYVYVLQQVLQRMLILGAESTFVVYIGPDATYSEAQTESVKLEYTTNPTIKALFNDIKTEEWSKERFTMNFLGHHVHIFPRGNWSRVRGELWRNNRPHVLIIDDLEKLIATMSEDQRAKTRRWFYEDVLGCVDRLDSEAQFRFLWIGNILHQDSTLSNLLEDPNWLSPEPIPLCDENLKSLVPGFSDAQVLALYNEYKAAEMEASFWREYAQMPVPLGADAPFRKEYFNKYKEADVQLDKPWMVTFLIIDPAKSDSGASARYGFVVLTYDQMTNHVYIRYIVHETMNQSRYLDTTVELIRRFRCTGVAVESTGLKEHLMYPLKNRLTAEHLVIEVVELDARGGPANSMKADDRAKVRRSRPLIPWYEQGRVFHNEAVTHLIEPYLLSWPAPRRWDVIDALAYFPQVLEKANWYAQPVGIEEAKFREYEQGFEATFASYLEETLPIYSFPQPVI